MQNFEISHSLTDIAQIWEAFFDPIVSTVVVFMFVYFLLGKEYINKIYHNRKLIKIDNKYYKQKHIRISKDNSSLNSSSKIIVLPLSGMWEKFMTILQNPIFFVMGLLLLVYTLYKIVNLCSSWYPIVLSYRTDSLLLYSVPKEKLACIWTYFPDYSLELLYHKIDVWGNDSSYAKYVDNSTLYMFCKISEFCSVLCIVRLFLNEIKVKDFFKTLFLFLFCTGMVILSFFLQFQNNVKVLEQKAYYVSEQLEEENPLVVLDFNKYLLASEKVENELRYVENEVFYGAFSLDFRWRRR